MIKEKKDRDKSLVHNIIKTQLRLNDMRRLLMNKRDYKVNKRKFKNENPTIQSAKEKRNKFLNKLSQRSDRQKKDFLPRKWQLGIKVCYTSWPIHLKRDKPIEPHVNHPMNPNLCLPIQSYIFLGSKPKILPPLSCSPTNYSMECWSYLLLNK